MRGAGPHVTPAGRGRRASLLVPPLALMGLIWFLSAQSDLKTELGQLDLVLRKCAHVTEFGLLTLLVARAVDGWRRPSRPLPALVARWWGAPLAAGAAVAIGWAAIDELHQHHVPGRVGTPRDVAIDAIGIAAAALLVRWAARRAPRPRPA
ncbi:VanZ family protein [Patulibacter defluvii]|uniref:VanZ family protein n=1 Tax=Patulibacter defluvii TaxID=3095358 RepID=UPI002A75FD94|nr:VanZ family protein [Patulibacter sp. DM4]